MKEFFKEIPREIKQGIAIALVIIVVFTSGNMIGVMIGGSKNADDAAATTQATTQPTTAPTTAPTTQATTAPTVAPSTAAPATTAAPTQADPNATTAPTTSAPATSAPASTGAPQTKAEIVAYYNESVNKIKTNAASATRNYEDLRHDTDKLQLPGALQSAGEKLISTFLKKNETPETYTGSADITAKFPIPGENWTSKLTEADVAEATCTDKGTEYEIMIKANTQNDPALGSGVGAGFEVIKSEDVMNAAGFIVKGFNTEYYDCVVKCKVDKATGNVTWINFTTPIIMKVDTKLGISAQVGMTFEKDYTIAY